MFLYFLVSEREMYYLGLKTGVCFCSFSLFFIFCEFANCKGGSVKTHLISNQFISKSHQSLLLDEVQRYETSTEIEKENASLKELGVS